MKGSSIATIVMIATATTVVAALMVNAVLGDPNEEKVAVSYMEPVVASVVDPDPEVFNINAVNPTVEVYVGNCGASQRWDEDEQRCVEYGIDDAVEPDDNEAGE